MTQKEKKLLFADMCARIPYDTIVLHNAPIGEHEIVVADAIDMACDIELCRPYLRPLSSMTEKEEEEYGFLLNDGGWGVSEELLTNCIDWLNAHHFDYRGLISKGLAIKAPKYMYN